MTHGSVLVAWAVAAACGTCSPLFAQEKEKKDFPDFKEVSEGFEKVVSTIDDSSFYALWTRQKDGQMLAELPRGWNTQEHFFAMTVATGEEFAGLQGVDFLAKWKRFDKRLALVAPNLGVRSNGDRESKNAVENIYTETVILDVPIVCMGPNGQPVIDMDELLLGNVGEFFGGQVRNVNRRLTTIAKSKSFPENNEIAFSAPVDGGTMKQLHFSVSKLRSSPGYKPRAADPRVGYFTTDFRDLGELDRDKVYVRYIDRWHLEKRDPSLKMSPPKQPIVFYIDNTVPVHYRRFVRDGLEQWNKAYEQVGIANAIEVRQQDAVTGAYMDIDPEDVRYNFIRWVTNETGLAIGPHRANPYTGEILDADVVVSDGWVRAWEREFTQVMPKIAMEHFDAETLAWLDNNPLWDPRIRMADPAQREYLMAERERRGILPYGGHPLKAIEEASTSDGLTSRLERIGGICGAAEAKAFDIALARLNLEAGLMGNVGESEGDVIEGMPESFIGPLLADLIAHEVGHTLGLRHNFKASGQFTLEEINSDAVKGKQPIAASVMDYLPTNFNTNEEWIQGDYSMIGVGPYDMWAIEYGYTTDEKKLADILRRSGEPQLAYGTDEDTSGIDPTCVRYDFSKNPLDFAKSQVEMAEYHRGRLLTELVKDGESWAKVRRAYQMTLSLQSRSMGMMSAWIGGTHVSRARKGDPNSGTPLQPVSAEAQRDALKFILAHAFDESAYGITPELLRHMSVDKWWDDGSASQDSTWSVNDRVLAVQAGVLTQLMNPSTLRRVYDNEFVVPGDEDAFTMPELLDAIAEAVWSDMDASGSAKYTARRPFISNFDRNLQREHVERLVSLLQPSWIGGSASRAISSLARVQLGDIKQNIESALDTGKTRLDPYSRAHLADLAQRIDVALEPRAVAMGDPAQTGFARVTPRPAADFRQDQLLGVVRDSAPEAEEADGDQWQSLIDIDTP